MTKYAGFWRRAGAFALDYILILVYLIAVTLVFLLLNTLFEVRQWLFGERIPAQVVAFLLITFPITLYFAVSESSVQQATWGKGRLGLKVADRTGKRIGFWRAFWRTALKFVPWELSHTLIWQLSFFPQTDSAWVNYGFVLVYLLIGLNILSLGVARRHQTLYDFLAGTYVVRTG